MKKERHFTLIALMTLIAGTASAGDTALTITLTDGHSATYLLSRKPTVSFADNNMVISVPEASAEYPLNEISDITFRENLPSAISSIGEENTLSYINGRISAPGKYIIVYDLKGNIIAGAQEEFLTETLSSDIYIVKADRESLKIKLSE